MKDQKENFTEPSAEEQAQATKFVAIFDQQFLNEFCKKHGGETISVAMEKIGHTPLTIYHTLALYNKSSKDLITDMTGRNKVSFGDVFLASSIFYKLLSPRQQREEYQLASRQLMGKK